MQIWPLLFNIISLQGNALSPSLFRSKKKAFPGPPSTRLLPLWRLHCFHTVYHEGGISVLGTDRSQKEPYKIWGWGRISTPHSIAAVMATFDVWAGELYCKIRPPLVSFPRFFLAINWCRRLNSPAKYAPFTCNLAQDIQSWPPIDYPKRFTSPAEWDLLNFLGGGEPGCFRCLLCIFDSGSMVNPCLILGYNSLDKIARIVFIGDRRYLEISSRVFFWSTVNINVTHLAETSDIPKLSVRTDCTGPKLMPSSLAMLRRSRLQGVYDLGISSVATSLGRLDRPSGCTPLLGFQ